MRRGTTPTLIFDLPFDTSMITEAWVTVAQGGENVIDKTIERFVHHVAMVDCYGVVGFANKKCYNFLMHY